MRSTQELVRQALLRTRQFLDANAELLDGVNKAKARLHLDEAAELLARYIVGQNEGARSSSGETAKQSALRQALRFDHMRPIALVARQKLRGFPEFEKLKMPRSNVSAAALIGAALGMAVAAAPHVEVLVEGGLGADFLDRLRAAVKEVQDSETGRINHTRTRIQSTAGLSAEERRGRYMLKVLDSMVRPRIRDNDTLLAAWRSAKSVRRPPHPVEEVKPVSTPTSGAPEVAA